MNIAGKIANVLQDKNARAFIDTIGEGAGVFSRLQELGYHNAISTKFSEGTRNLHDITGQYSFANMRAYCFWAVRDWLNPKNKFMPALPPNDRFTEEATSIKWSFQSNGSIIIEPKEKIKERLKRSTDNFDALSMTFYPNQKNYVEDDELLMDFY